MFNTRLDAELTALNQLFKTAGQFLQQTEVNGQKLKQAPWYLLIGPQQSGKSTFIQESELPLLPASHLHTTQENESTLHKRCNWWFNDKATIIDVPGAYLTTQKPTGEQPINWLNFLGIAKKYFQTKKLSGLILTISFADWLLLNKEQQQTKALELRKILLQFSHTIKYACPVYLIFTKLDQIAGFTDFFSDLGQEERYQPLGFSLQAFATEKNPALTSLFKKQFDQLLSRLHSRVIWRTHQERSHQKRVIIQQFPWQLETAKNSLNDLLYQLGDLLSLHGKKPLQGIYFVSNKQHDAAIDFLPKPLAGHLVTHTEPALITTKQSYAYFSQQLLTQIIFSNTATILNQHDPKKWYATTYFAAAGLVGFTCIYLAYSFNVKLAHLNNAETAFITYEVLAKQLLPVDTNLNQTIPTLNALQQTLYQLDKARLPIFVQDLHRSATINRLANKAYHQELVHYFLPGIQSSLENSLSTTSDPNLLYAGLKIYLMLGDPERFDAKAIKNWFDLYWLNSTTTIQQKNLVLHLNNLLANPIPPVILNQTLIAKIRATLNALPATQLANILLKSNSLNDTVNFTAKIPSFNKVFTLTNNAAVIPTLYTAQKFADIYFKQIPNACKIAINGDWILGNNSHFTPFNVSPTLITQVRLQYLMDYAAYWQKLITNLALTDWQTWQQAEDTFNVLLSTQSPLQNILTIINKNTALTNLLPASINLSAVDAQVIQATLAQPFQSLNSLLLSPNDQQNSGLDHALLFLKPLQQYLITSAPKNNDNKTVFLAVQQRFDEDNTDDPLSKLFAEANNVPAPLKDWLTGLSNNVWRLMLNNTAQYLNQVYQDRVTAFYQSHLADRYPLVKNSTQDISLDDFKQFFGLNGIMTDFYKAKLAVFIDSSDAKWRLREINGQTLGMSAEALLQFERAALIKSMFFANENALNVTFSLQPIAIESNVRKVVLDLNGTLIEDQQLAITEPHFVTWPNINKPAAATLIFTNDAGQIVNKNELGPWALFRLFDTANLQQMNNSTKDFQLTFDLNGNAARYRLIADNAINPFIPGIIDQFRCPTSLQ